ncbi:MAG: sugar phosphate isomerase/epimerase [archaeon GB-1867-005]|nr:sugar phosphate isomerase/epimerase [Candidatus Culexmicrobium cathedralense]
MKIGAMNNPYQDLISEIKFIGNAKFDYIDLTAEKPEASPSIIAEKRREIIDTLSTYNLEVVGHTPWYLELGHPYESVRKAFLKEALKIIDILGSIEITKTTIHPIPAMLGVYKVRKYRRKMLNWMIESIREISGRAEDYGMIIVIENLDGGKILTLEDYDEIIAKANCYFHLDVGHANLNLPRNTSTEFINHFGAKGMLKHVHVSDNVGGTMKGGWDLHLPIGAGKINFKEIFKALKKVKYDDTITVEVFSADRDYLLMSKEKVKKLWEEVTI